MRHLKRIEEFRPFDSEDYEDYFEKEWHCQLVNIPYGEARTLYDAFVLVPRKLIRNVIDQVAFDPGLGMSDRFFPNHGRWDDDNKIMYLNRTVFDLEGKEALHLITHEVGHAVDSHMGDISTNDKTWLGFSGWTQTPSDITPVQQSDDNLTEFGKYERLKIEEDDLLMVSEWWHLKDASFVRWYASRNPMEDMAESFSYCVLGENDRFAGCGDKRKYVKERMLQ